MKYENRAMMTDDERILVDLANLRDNLQDFVLSIKECRRNAAQSPTGRCEHHRHGRKDWKIE